MGFHRLQVAEPYTGSLEGRTVKVWQASDLVIAYIVGAEFCSFPDGLRTSATWLVKKAHCTTIRFHF